MSQFRTYDHINMQHMQQQSTKLSRQLFHKNRKKLDRETVHTCHLNESHVTFVDDIINNGRNLHFASQRNTSFALTLIRSPQLGKSLHLQFIRSEETKHHSSLRDNIPHHNKATTEDNKVVKVTHILGFNIIITHSYQNSSKLQQLVADFSLSVKRHFSFTCHIQT